MQEIGTKYSGWDEGECNIQSWTNQSCQMSPCTFFINVHLKGGQVGILAEWEPPVERDGENVNAYSSWPLRCCNTLAGFDCCHFWDKEAMAFCDDWGHKKDDDGDCPSGRWPCLALPHSSEPSTYVNVVAAAFPPIWPALAVAFVAAVWSLCGGFYSMVAVVFPVFDGV